MSTADERARLRALAERCLTGDDRDVALATLLPALSPDVVLRLLDDVERAERDIRTMVEKAAAQSLDGYRELGQRAADAERQRDAERARAERLEAIATMLDAVVQGAQEEFVRVPYGASHEDVAAINEWHAMARHARAALAEPAPGEQENPHRENSAEWFEAEVEAVRRRVQAWPEWMRRTMDWSTATFPAAPGGQDAERAKGGA